PPMPHARLSTADRGRGSPWACWERTILIKIVRVVALAFAVAMLAPSAVAAWYSYGAQEPSTSFDATQGYMWTDGPDPADCGATASCEVHRVYFNAFPVQAAAIKGQTALNPNDAMLGSRMEPVGTLGFKAWLGQWTDCNHDGYIGLADGALREYRDVASAAAGFPVDQDICPSLDDNNPANAGFVHYNAVGGWVTEMIYIGDTAPTAGSHSRDLTDPKAVVWADFGAPVAPDGDVAPPSDGACSQATYQPGEGESRTMGRLLRHLDCVDGSAPTVAYNLLANNDPTGTVAGNVPAPRSFYTNGGPLDGVSPGGPGEACPGGAPEPCDGSNSFVYGEIDCSHNYETPVLATIPGQDTGIGDPTSDNGDSIKTSDRDVGGDTGVPMLGVPPHTNPQGGAVATLNETAAEGSLSCNT